MMDGTKLTMHRVVYEMSISGKGRRRFERRGIPMPMSVSVIFDGNCREAVRFYAEVFGQECPAFLTYAEAMPSNPDLQTADSMRSRVQHTVIDIGGMPVRFCDTPESFGFSRGSAVTLTVTYENPQEAQRVFDRLSKGGYIDVPFQKQPDGGYYGLVEDQFRISWEVLGEENKAQPIL